MSNRVLVKIVAMADQIILEAIMRKKRNLSSAKNHQKSTVKHQNPQKKMQLLK